MKVCAYCQQPLERRPQETKSNYDKRNTCNRSCAASLKHQANALRKTDAQPAPAVDGPPPPPSLVSRLPEATATALSEAFRYHPRLGYALARAHLEAAR
jgi:hypothetical protein